MSAILNAESTLTERYQTTVPEPVRRALQLSKRDKIHYAIHANGEVVLTRVVPQEDDDPMLEAFLAFLARDINSHPEHLRAVGSDLVQRMGALLAGMEVDLDSPLSDDGE